ncbi:MAG: metallophosphoesterase family protein [Solirubrobacteraceae bacterium]
MFDELRERLKDLVDHHGAQPAAAAPDTSGRIVREVTDPQFLHDQLQAVQRAAAARDGGNQLSAGAYQAAFDALEQAQATHPAGEPVMPKDATASIFQSVLSTCIESRADKLIEDLPEGLRRIAHAVLSLENVFREFGPCDPLWMETKVAEGIAALTGRPPFPNAPAPPLPLAKDARVIVVGDWGTGLPGATAVAERMQEQIEDGRGREQHVVHLGDVYYSGWREEYETRFLPHWPVAPGEEEVLSWALNGNHDMYSGGHGYFGFLLHDHRFRGHWLPGGNGQHTTSSHFSLENEHWQLLGVDSAYRDHDLDGNQAQWVGAKLATGRKTMLMSHHQPFSGYEAVSQAMVHTLTPALGGRVIDAWIWGHEHRCMVYGPQQTPGAAPSPPAPYLKWGSCIGHGGVPRLLPDPPLAFPPKPTWVLEEYVQQDGNRWGRFGFAVLDFDGPSLRVRYIDETGKVNHEESL